MRLRGFLGFAPLILLFFCPIEIQSQDLVDDVNKYFQYLNLTDCSTNFLLDKGLGLRSWEHFDGTFPSDELSNDIDDWFWHYTCLESAQIEGENPYLTRKRYIDLYDSLDANSVIPLSILALEFDEITETAFDDSLIIYNPEGYLEDNPAATTSPYQKDTVSIGISTLANSDIGELSFVLPDSMILTNLEINMIEIDFDDGEGYVPMTPNQAINVSYLEVGEKFIVFKILLSNNAVLYAKGKIDITGIADEEREYGETPDATLYGFPFGTRVNIFYSNDCQELQKPLIYVEGFNPVKLFSTDFEIMLKKFDLQGANGTDFNYPEVSGETLWEEFYNQGYDIIFVDFGDGAGDIFDNAEALEAVIKEVNQRKAAANIVADNTIIGASMGGVISYRTLTMLEQEGYDHEVVDFFTFDSPLRGANIPYGLQCFVKYFGETKIRGNYIKDLFPVLRDVDEVLNSKAARQMLYYHVSHPNPSFQHDQFYDTLHQYGKPNVNHIAIANGSGIGEGQLIQPGEQLLRISGIYTPADTIGKGQLVFHKLEVNFGNLPNASFKRVYLQSIYVQTWKGKIVLHVGGYHDIEFDELSYDSAPGSTQNFGFPDQIGEVVAGVAVDFPERMQWCFVPTVSAMNIAGTPDPYMNLQAEPCGGGEVLRCNYSIDDSTNSPYNSQPEHNQSHVSINSSVVTSYLTHMYRPSVKENILDDRNFNFGETENFPEDNTADDFNVWRTDECLDHNLDVVGTGQLLINNLDKIGYSTDQNSFTGTNSNFKVRLKSGCDEEVALKIENGGQFHIGQPGIEATNSGEFIVSDNTQLIIGNGGKTKVNTNGQLIIENRGQVVVNDGGILETRAAQIIIKDGGLLRVNHDAVLRSSWGGEIIVEEGGTFEVDAGVLDLHGPNGVLRVNGTLRIINSFEFANSGYIEFHASHSLEVENNWTFDGSGKFDTNIKLLDSTILKFINTDFDLNHTTVEYGFDTKIKMTAGAFNSVGVVLKSQPQSAFGLELDGLSSVNTLLTNFENFSTGISILNYLGQDPVEINLTDFTDCETSIILGVVSKTKLYQTKITGSDVGLLAAEAAFISVTGSTFNGSTGSVGAFLTDVDAFYVTNSTIQDWTTGIYCPIGATANVFLHKNATLKNNDIGVHIEKGNTNGTDTDGLVLADCARFINNTVGIMGEDLQLKVDAIENCGNCPVSERAPNYFIIPPGGVIFDICFNGIDNDQLYARGNYWGEVQPNQWSYKVKRSDGFDNCFENVSVDTSEPFLSEHACGGFNGPEIPTHDPTGITDCEIVVSQASKNSTTAFDDFNFGYSFFRNGQFAQAFPRFQTVANVNQSARDGGDFICRHYVDVSRAMVTALNTDGFYDLENDDPAEFTIPEIHDLDTQTKTPDDFKIYPNPADDQLHISYKTSLPNSGYIYNTLGVLMWSDVQIETAQINTSSWPSGIYYCIVKDVAGQILEREKIIIH